MTTNTGSDMSDNEDEVSYFRSYPRQPLINYVTNEWQKKPNLYTPSPSPSRDLPAWLQTLISISKAPKFRRFVLIYFILVSICWGTWVYVLEPRALEQEALLKALDLQTMESVGGWFGSNAVPKFPGIVQLRSLDPDLLPRAEPPKTGEKHRRLVIVGDVHGCKDELEALLEKVSFNRASEDHLIFTGDIINKGPKSTEVVDLARSLHASCVRGNHEDRILLLRHQLRAQNALQQSNPDDDQEIQIARQLTEEQVAWLEGCPIILKVGGIHGMGQVVVVHGGLVPGLALEKQDPASVMNMRTIDLDTHVPSASKDGIHWTKLFNKHQSLTLSRLKESGLDPQSGLMTVVYGHDASSSLNIKEYTKGLDSGCVKGKKLSALVIEDGGRQSIVQVDCKQYSS